MYSAFFQLNPLNDAGTEVRINKPFSWCRSFDSAFSDINFSCYRKEKLLINLSWIYQL